MQSISQKLKKLLTTFLVALMIAVHLSFTFPLPAFASSPLNFVLPKHLKQLLSNKQLVEDAKRFANTTPESFCRAYHNKSEGIDNSTWAAIEEGATSVFTITQMITSASSAGAGALAGYAGIASAVAHLGLGGLTTTIAGMMGSSATGAAATAVVTSAIGGPLVMGALLASGTGAAVFGSYELGKFGVEKLGSWAESYCLNDQVR